MTYKKSRKSTSIFTSILMLIIIGGTANAYLISDTYDNNINYNSNVSSDGYIDITVNEAWEMLTDSTPENGIQIPIDVRTTAEWDIDRIDTPYPEQPVNFVLAVLETPEGLDEFFSLYDGQTVVMYCKAGGRSKSASEILVDNGFSGIIYNMLGGISEWKSEDLPIKKGNTEPYIPTISGSNVVILGEEAIFSCVANDLDDDAVKYGLDWNNDNNVDEWTSYYPSGQSIDISYTWTESGTFSFKIKSQDHVGGQSGFSEVFEVTVNLPPNDPEITGPTKGKPGVEQEYTVVTTDPDGDQVSYCFDWGDDSGEVCLGPFAPGEEVPVTHTWAEEGTYTIKVKARDIHNAESDEVTLEVSMPKNKIISHPFLRFLNLQQNLFLKLMQILSK